MMQNLFYSPGQTATVFLEVLNANGVRADNTFLDGYYRSTDGYTFGNVDGYVAARVDGYFISGIVDGYITETVDGYVNAAIDGYITSALFPTVNRIIFPDFSLSAGYPVRMIQLDVGLYYFKFTLPTGASAVGSYLIDISFTDPTTLLTKKSLYQIVVNAPYGNYGITVG